MDDQKQKQLNWQLLMFSSVGMVSKIEELLTAGADPNFMDPGGTTALMNATQCDNLEVITKLIESGASVDAANMSGKTALMFAVSHGKLEVVTKLIESGAIVDRTDKEGMTALLYASRKRKWAIVEKLMDSGATNLDATDSDGMTALLYAANNDRLDIINKLLDKGAANLDATDLQGKTVLMLATRKHLPEVVSKLIDAGANVNATGKSGMTALLCAAMSYEWDIVKKFIDLRATNLDATDSDGQTALLCAAGDQDWDVVSELLDAGARNLDATDWEGKTALEMAIENGQFGIASKLHNAGASVDVTDEDGNTLLMMYAKKGSHEIVSHLVKLGANLNMTNEKQDDDTALIMAAHQGMVDVVSELIHAGAYLDFSNIRGETPLLRAAKNGHLEVVSKLIDAGASVHISDKHSQTVLMVATENRHFDVVEKVIHSGAIIDTVNKYHKTAEDIAQEKGYNEVYEELLKARGEVAERPPVLQISKSDLKFGDVLGSGAAGTVYKGEWLSRNTKVAIKRVVGMMNTKEVEILNRIKHPNIIMFFGEVTDNRPDYYIVLELSEGGSLYQLIYERNFKPNNEQRLQWAREIAEGMKYLHQEKIIHRDLKSKNVLLTTNWDLKICDFGEAKQHDHTTVVTQAGTWRWMAPEIINGDPVSLSCDVFSYGMVLLEIYTCKVPYASISDREAAEKIRSGEVPNIPKLFEQFIVVLMKRCWGMDPKARPSFSDIIDILKNKVCEDLADDEASHTEGVTILTKYHLLELEANLKGLENQWYPLGMALNLTPQMLVGIPALSHDKLSFCLLFVLLAWLSVEDPPPTLESLVAAISDPSVGGKKLAKGLLESRDKFMDWMQ